MLSIHEWDSELEDSIGCEYFRDLMMVAYASRWTVPPVRHASVASVSCGLKLLKAFTTGQSKKDGAPL